MRLSGSAAGHPGPVVRVMTYRRRCVLHAASNFFNQTDKLPCGPPLMGRTAWGGPYNGCLELDGIARIEALAAHGRASDLVSEERLHRDIAAAPSGCVKAQKYSPVLSFLTL